MSTTLIHIHVFLSCENSPRHDDRRNDLIIAYSFFSSYADILQIVSDLNMNEEVIESRFTFKYSGGFAGFNVHGFIRYGRQNIYARIFR